jgi:hypothetical protein
MCNKVVGNILGNKKHLGKYKDPSKNKGGWDEVSIEESNTLDGRGRPITYLQHKRSKRTPKEITEDINKKFKTR